MTPSSSVTKTLLSFQGWSTRKGTVDKETEECNTQNPHPLERDESQQPSLDPEGARNIREVLSSLLRRLSSRKDGVNKVAEENPGQLLSSSPEFRATSKTIVQSASLLLELLASVSNTVPFNPLTSIVGGIQVLFGQYEKFQDNNEEVQNLKHNLERLYERIQPTGYGSYQTKD
ncbi:hypothetical protein GYMLUDRAFT_586358 [Collybiopsis luxurians FD-317 M1]|uniref:Unplaced genomic scaffold GYMLUscaffold_24, whole genome shotgun sequence n=1 Tax=Collybiopsis luxurians FD-317 M1 TaxID=944289 RepID=A0A0D0BYW7_9AGAR|nr:hypothetical protein GYMLUDRAFT_586358 [Collybiopsis luxurians FD-317 M1]